MGTILKGFSAWYYASENCTVSCSGAITHSTINPVISEVLSACSFADHHLKKGQKIILSFLKGELQIGIVKCSDGSVNTTYIAKAVKNNKVIADISSSGFDAGMLSCLLSNDITNQLSMNK